MQLKCAVVGANGFLGKALVKKLVEENYQVTAVFNRSFDNVQSGVDKICIEGFLGMKKQFDFVFLSLGNYQCSHHRLIDINNTILHILQNQFSAKVIFISSTNVYGIHNDVINNNSPFNNPTLYPFSKLAGEFLVSSHNEYAILRLTYLYGKGLDNKSFLPNIIEKAKSGRITLFGDGSRKQDYLHVDDAVELCIASAKIKKNDIYIGASGISTSNNEVVKIISAKYRFTVEYQGNELGSSFYFDIKYTQQKLKWTPKWNIIDGLNNMLS